MITLTSIRQMFIKAEFCFFLMIKFITKMFILNQNLSFFDKIPVIFIKAEFVYFMTKSITKMFIEIKSCLFDDNITNSDVY